MTDLPPLPEPQALAPLSKAERDHVIGQLRRNHDAAFVERVKAALAAQPKAEAPGADRGEVEEVTVRRIDCVAQKKAC